MTAPIRLILVDDHAILRQGTAELLRREMDLAVVGEAGNGHEALTLVDQLHPDVVVMDIRMPGMSGVEATSQIHSTWPTIRILVLSAYDDEQYIFSLLQNGASGYLLKSVPIGELVKAIRQVHAGESPLDPTIASKIVSRMSRASNERITKTSMPDQVDELTDRELEILQCLTLGLSNRAIADKLFISDRTVQAHLTSIYSKMAVTTRLDAVLKAIRQGTLKLDT
jgi:two-component system, NarL family, response regulator LiaR